MNGLIRLPKSRRIPDQKTAQDVIYDMKSKQHVSDFELLADSFAYHMAPPEHSIRRLARNSYDWVASAAADQHDDRYYLRYLQADGTYLVATNGVRIHIKRDNRAAGMYLPLNERYFCHIDRIEYPNILDYMTHVTPIYRIRDMRCKRSPESTRSGLWLRIDVPYAPDFPAIHVNASAFEKAISGFDNHDWVDAVPGGTGLGRHQYDTGALHLVSDTRHAMIMGLSTDAKMQPPIKENHFGLF